MLHRNLKPPLPPEDIANKAYWENQISIQPSLDEIRNLLEQSKSLPEPPNLIPLCASISSEFLTPSAIYLKIAAQ